MINTEVYMMAPCHTRMTEALSPFLWVCRHTGVMSCCNLWGLRLPGNASV